MLATTSVVDAISLADAVVVATPIGAHVQSVRCALACGRHVLVETPVAASARAAMELVSLAESSGARLFVGHSERFNPVIRALARLVEPASIRAIELRRVGARQAPARRAGGGAREPRRPRPRPRGLPHPLRPSPPPGASRPKSVPDLGAPEERADVLARTDLRRRASTSSSISAPADSVRRRTIVLTTPTHVWHGDLLAPSLVRTCRASSAREAIPLDTEEPLLAQALAFAGRPRRREAPHEIATGLDGMRALVVAERARRQLGRPRGEGENLAFHARL